MTSVRWRPSWSDAVIVAAVLFAFRPTLAASAHIPYDAEYYHYPLLRSVQELLSSGRLPAWDSFTYGGSPLLANSQSAWQYPPHLLIAGVLAVLGAPLSEHTLDVVLVVHLVVAGLATGAIARHRGLGEPAAAYAGAFVVLTGYTVAQAQHVGLIEALPWIALAVLAVDHLAEGITALRVIALGLTFALAITAGFLPVIPAMVALIVCAALARAHGRRPAIIGAVAGIALGVAMAATAVIPTAMLLNVYPPLPVHGPLATSGLVTAVLPNAFGHWDPHIAQFTGQGLTNSYFYLGGSALVLLPIAITSGRAALLDALLVLVLILGSFGTIAQHVATVLQGLPAVGPLWRPEDVVFVAAVPFSLLLARGLARPPSKAQLASAALAVIVLALISFTGGVGTQLQFLSDAPQSTLVALGATGIALAATIALGPRHRTGAGVALAIAAVIGAADLALAVPPRYFVNAPGAATSAGRTSAGDNPSVLTFLWRHTDAQDRVAADVANIGPPWAGFPSLWHLSDANGFQPQFSKYQLAAAQPPGHSPPLGGRELPVSPSVHTYLEEMGVRYIIVAPSTDPFQHVAGYVPVFQDSMYRVYRTSWPHDRAYLVDPVCLRRRRADDLIACRTPAMVTTAMATNERRYRFRPVAATTQLVTGEPWYPGWHATDSAGSLPVHRAGFLTAISVPARTDAVNMTYTPPGLAIGAVVSLLAFAGSVAAIAYERRRRAVQRVAGASPLSDSGR